MLEEWIRNEEPINIYCSRQFDVHATDLLEMSANNSCECQFLTIALLDLVEVNGNGQLSIVINFNPMDHRRPVTGLIFR